MTTVLAQLITGAHPASDSGPNISLIGTMALGIIYLILGIAASFCVGIAVGSLVGAIRSLFLLFKSKTAWLAVVTFAFTSYIGLSFAVGALPIAGNLGDITGYKMQMAMFVGAVLGLGTWIWPISMLAIGSKELALSNSFRSFAFLYGALIYYVCGFLGLYVIFAYLTQTLSPVWLLASLLVYPVTFLVAPVVMVIKHGIWLPILLNFGGLILGGFVMSLGKDKR